MRAGPMMEKATGRRQRPTSIEKKMVPNMSAKNVRMICTRPQGIRGSLSMANTSMDRCGFSPEMREIPTFYLVLVQKTTYCHSSLSLECFEDKYSCSYLRMATHPC